MGRWLRMEPTGKELPPFLPGQFTMLYAFGIGEVPISVSGDADVDGPARVEKQGRRDRRIVTKPGSRTMNRMRPRWKASESCRGDWQRG